MKSSPKSKAQPVDRAFIESELKDAKAQRDTAQQHFNDAQAQMQQSQQNANAAQAMILTANGACQQNENILKEMDARAKAGA